MINESGTAASKVMLKKVECNKVKKIPNSISPKRTVLKVGGTPEKRGGQQPT
jgi:hypothetical protein